MISIANFKLKYNPEKNVHYVMAGEKIACPTCGGVLKKNGRPKRTLIKADGTKQKLKVQRYKCKDCNASHRELPDMVVPYKHLEREVIEQIINGEPTENGQEESTIRHIIAWWNALKVYIAWYTAALKEHIGVCISLTVKNLAQIVRALVNTNLWPSPRLNMMPGP